KSEIHLSWAAGYLHSMACSCRALARSIWRSHCYSYSWQFERWSTKKKPAHCLTAIKKAMAVRAVASLHHANEMLWFFSGIERTRWPVAVKNALRTAGAATKIVGSPTPPQNPPDGMMIDSTLGISAIRIELYVSKLVCSMRPASTVHSP